MPAVKQGGGYTLTFAKKNQDVRDHLDKLKAKKVVITDYICEAIRFYEENKSKTKSDTIDPTILDRMIEDKIKIFIEDKFTSNQDNTESLEDKIGNISDDDLDED